MELGGRGLGGRIRIHLSQNIDFSADNNKFGLFEEDDNNWNSAYCAPPPYLYLDHTNGEKENTEETQILPELPFSFSP